MIMDIAAGIIIVLSAVFYCRRGFAASVINMLQWFLCIVVGLLLCDNATRLLTGHTGAGNFLNGVFEKKLASTGSPHTQAQSVYDVFHGYISSNSQMVSNPGASDITQIVLAILSFFVIIAAVKLLLWLFCKIFPKESYDGIRRFFDRLTGIVCGTGMGVIYVLLALTMLLALMAALPSGIASALSGTLDSSFVTGSLYTNNPLLPLLRNLFT
ncbi:MAG: CvpA family protein [Hornefia butyriciproducens]|uniref:CvpA family protein n=1 Tax=Hornefia butyriciproducens TaxID=2652293 RepID=UPI002A760D39|nr:CvpA family protein [Hornefia butyriciproducens]MDY2990335.1 CvpA family protein [Hornefia butyriciproducens]